MSGTTQPGGRPGNGSVPKSAEETMEPTVATAEPGADRWLKSQLRKLYDDVASEPLPPDLAALIQKLDEKNGGTR